MGERYGNVNWDHLKKDNKPLTKEDFNIYVDVPVKNGDGIRVGYRPENAVLLNRLRSVIQGLLKENEKEIKEIERDLKYLKRDGIEPYKTNSENYNVGKLLQLRRDNRKIKKWLGAVLEENK